MDLDLDLLFLDYFHASENVKYCRLVILWEQVMEIIANKAGFSNRGVANEHDFDRLLANIIIIIWIIVIYVLGYAFLYFISYFFPCEGGLLSFQWIVIDPSGNLAAVVLNFSV